MRLPYLLAFPMLAGALGCGQPPVAGQAMLVTVKFAPSSNSRCAIVRVAGEGAPRSTAAMLRAERTSLQVAIYRDALPATVTLEAEGFSDDGCTVPLERSEPKPATFSFSRDLTRVTLQLSGDQNGDGGFQPDGGDAGVELCTNRLDDNGDGLIDCADPACGPGVTCDDGDLCTTSDVCAGLLCTPRLRSCAGQLLACMIPAGCDAGVCLAAPAPALQFCDGGRCDGVGRCAPFCDPTRAGLRVCYQFESALTDGSGKGNDATGSSFTFDAGVRGLAWVAGTAGLVVRDHSSLDCTTELTVEAWVRPTAFPRAGTRFGVLDNDGQYGVFIGPGGELRCPGGLVVAGALTLSTWQHVACIRGNGTMKAYRDGVERGSIIATGTLGLGNGEGLKVGQNSPSGDVLQGALDGLRVWCEALPRAELCTVPGDCG